MNKHIIISFAVLFLLSISNNFAQKKLKKLNAKKDYLITISTHLGDMYLILYDDTPSHKANFAKLAHEGFYNGIKFHRVMKNFMIQGGDPNSKEGGDATKIGTGGPGYTLDAEIVDTHLHKKGVLAAARQPDRVNPEKKSSGSQFYIVHSEKGTKHLNGGYTVYGEVIKGLDVVDKIAGQPVDRRKGNRPKEDITMTVKVEVLKKKKITELYGYSYD